MMTFLKDAWNWIMGIFGKKTPSLSGLTLIAGNKVVGGTAVTGTVTLSGAAPKGGQGVTFNLDPIADGTKIPTCVVPAGATSANFTVTFNKVTKNTTVTIWANSGPGSGTTLHYPVTVTAAVAPPPVVPTLSSLTTNLATVPSAGQLTITAHLTSAATSAAVVAIASSPALGLTSITVPAGATSSSANVGVPAETANTTFTVTGTFGATAKVSFVVSAAVVPPPPPPPPTGPTSGNVVVNAGGAVQADGTVVPAGSTGTIVAGPQVTNGVEYVNVAFNGSASQFNGWTPVNSLSAAVTPPPPTPPVVSITAPVAGATVSGTITASATASDAQGVASVQWQLDGTSGTNLGTDSSAPYTETIDTTKFVNGAHTLTAIAKDVAGLTTTSTGVAITVNNVAPPPPPPPPVLTTITLAPSTVSLQVGQTATFTAQGFDQNGKTFAITPIFSASSDGTFNGAVFTATAAGAATIHATANGVTSNAATVTITAVVPPPPPPPPAGSLAAGLGTPTFSDSFNYKTSKDAAFTKNWNPQSYTGTNYAGAGSNVQFSPNNITFPLMSNGQPCLCLTLSQSSASASSGAEMLSNMTMGYGTYEFFSRMGSTSSTPNGTGSAVSGGVSSTFLISNDNGGTTGYVEIDAPECEGDHATWAEYDIWFNGDGSGDNNQPSGPGFISQGAGEDTVLVIPNMVTDYNFYGFIWSPGRIDFYLNGKLQGSLTKGVPVPGTGGNTPVIDINHYGCNGSGWGGKATPGTTRFFYVQSAKFWAA